MRECMEFRDISALLRENFVNISLARFPDSTTVKVSLQWESNM